MIFLWALMLMSLAIAASVQAGTIYLEELLEITQKMPRSETPITDAVGIDSGTSWPAHTFQDALSVPAIPDDNDSLEVLEKDVPLIPFLELARIDPKELKQLELELHFSGSPK